MCFCRVSKQNRKEKEIQRVIVSENKKIIDKELKIRNSYVERIMKITFDLAVFFSFFYLRFLGSFFVWTS